MSSAFVNQYPPTEWDFSWCLICWKNFKIGTKLTIGFGSLLALILFISSLSIVGFSNIRKTNEDLTHKRSQAKFILDKTLDHLRWADQITDLFMKDEVTTLTVETQYRKCGLGKWIYSPRTGKMMEKDNTLAQLVEQVKAPHESVRKSDGPGGFYLYA